MNCKFCNAEVSEEHKFCPFCGKNMTQEEEETLLPAEADMEETVEEAAEETTTEQPVQKKKVWPLVLAIAGAVVALGALAVVLLTALGVNLLPRANDIFVKDSYSVEDDKAAKKSDTVVATIGDRELTNIQLQIYYRMQVMDFLNYYGSYASSIGLDTSKPLSEQTCYFDDTMTWEQYFLDIAIDTWQNYQALALQAEENGHTLGEDWQSSLDSMPADLQTQAEEGEFESVDAMLEDVIGPGCTQESYMEYVKLVYLSNDYYSTQYELLTPTHEEAEVYFTENEATFAEQGITKESGLISTVRHILIAPEGGTTDEETGTTTYTDAEWAAALTQAEKVLDEWKAGEATEESFGTLATTYTDDTGSASTGGLYEGIAPGSNYVEEFLAWAIDMNRQTGDTDIVKTEFGYHIMYFVSGEPYWLSSAETQLLSERTAAMIDEAEAKWPMKVNYRKIALAELEL
ncbi:MAG: peptidylprolyl isomerase [Oscillospiraceae bacterium]|nr:peptidylprolyl isomerase [Oscillospiraceae bacterium]